jgi:Malonate decarboxylase, alpha subunit, transporter
VLRRVTNRKAINTCLAKSIFSPPPWQVWIRRGFTICTWRSRSWRYPTISPCSNAASRTCWILRTPDRKAAGSPNSLRRRPLKTGAIHTYLELYARTLVNPTPQVVLVVADKADRNGNLYTGPNTEETPEAAAFRGGIVVA